MSFNLLLHNVTKPFYFGIGGLGDAFLLLSTFYDKIEKDTTDVVFVANDTQAILKLSKLPMFGKISRWWIYPRSAFVANESSWDQIYRNEWCLGTGVTPKRFDYVRDWIECGKHSVFDYYGVVRNPEWAKRRESVNPKYITVQMFGGYDANRISIMTIDFVENIVKRYNDDYSILLVGSPKDSQKVCQIAGTRWVTDMADSVDRILLSHKHYSVNSWTKTLSALAGVPTVIYPSSYKTQPQLVFGCPQDPSDYVFLNDWEFEYA